MCEAIRVRVRYYQSDENNKTRHERNEDYDQAHLTPIFDVPENVEYLYDWYFEISDSLRRVIDNVCGPIPPSELLAWVTLTGNVVRPFEYAILRQMDEAFCSETNKELQDFLIRQAESNE